MGDVLGTLRPKFRDVFPVIGNNDAAIHDQMPCDDDMAQIYFSELFDLWFPLDHSPANFNHDQAKSTFL